MPLQVKQSTTLVDKVIDSSGVFAVHDCGGEDEPTIEVMHIPTGQTFEISSAKLAGLNGYEVSFSMCMHKAGEE